MASCREVFIHGCWISPPSPPLSLLPPYPHVHQRELRNVSEPSSEITLMYTALSCYHMRQKQRMQTWMQPSSCPSPPRLVLQENVGAPCVSAMKICFWVRRQAHAGSGFGRRSGSRAN